MPGSYVKDAYKMIYKHDSWEKEAREYETSLGVMLYKSPYVINAAQTALQKLSKVLTAYYGENPDQKKSPQAEEQLAEASVVGDVAAKITGQETPGAGVKTQAKQEPKTGKEEDQPPTLAPLKPQAGEEEDQPPALAPLKPQAGEEEDQPPALAPLKPQAAVSEAPKAAAGPVPGSESGDIPVTDTLMRSYLRNDPGSAGQIGSMNEGDDLTRLLDVQETDAVLNKDGNLREKMTMIFNSALMNGGMTDEQTSSSVTLKRILRDVTREEVAGNAGLSGLNMDAIEKVRKKKKDIFGIGRLVSGLGHTSIGEKISAFFGSRSRKRKEKKPDGQEPGLGYDYYEKLGIAPSEREMHNAGTMVDGKKVVKWKEGVAYWDIDHSSFWAKKMAAKGRILTAGPSGTAQRMLSAYRFLGATDKELLDFRLALLGWMLSSQDHSLYEIMMGGQTVGVKGKEDLSEAAEMYRTVDPVSTDQLRNNAAIDKQFPHERVFKMILGDVMRKRAAATGHTLEEVGNLTSFQDLGDKSAQELAINMYTTAAYKTMTPSQKYGSTIGKWQMRLNRSKTRTSATAEGAYEGSEVDAQAKPDSEMDESVFGAIQMASRISYEGLAEAGSKAPVEDEAGTGGDAEEGKLATTAYKGTVYRGEGISKLSRKYNKIGNTVTLSAMTSTSKDFDRADEFRSGVNSKWKKPVLLTIKLNGISGVDISEISKYAIEQEVLVPEGTQFRVSQALTEDGEGKYDVELEEISGRDSYLKQAAGVDGLVASGINASQQAEESEPSVPEETAEDVKLPQSLAEMLEDRESQLGDEGIANYVDAMEIIMSTMKEDSDLYQQLEQNGIHMSDKKYATKLVNWYLACAMDFEFGETMKLTTMDLKEKLEQQIPSILDSQALMLKSTPM